MGNIFSTVQPASFQSFYPQLGSDLTRIRDNQCNLTDATYRSSIAASDTRERCRIVLDCILDNASEVTKGEMATTSIVLGLTPTVLFMMGSSTVELCMLSTQRPLLALCITLGSPMVWPMRPFQQIDLRDEMRPRDQRRTIPTMGPLARIAVTVLQYALVLGSIANVASIAYELGTKSISFGFSCNERYGPLLWVFLAAAVHLVGLIGFVSRLRHPSTKSTGTRHTLSTWLRSETTPCISHQQRDIIWKPESAWYLFFSFCASTATAIHMVLGIATLGSVQLVGATDARTIIGRFLASALVCRCVLMFELAGLRERLHVVVEGEHQDDSDSIWLSERPRPTQQRRSRTTPARYGVI